MTLRGALLDEAGLQRSGQYFSDALLCGRAPRRPPGRVRSRVWRQPLGACYTSCGSLRPPCKKKPVENRNVVFSRPTGLLDIPRCAATGQAASTRLRCRSPNPISPLSALGPGRASSFCGKRMVKELTPSRRKGSSQGFVLTSISRRSEDPRGSRREGPTALQRNASAGPWFRERVSAATPSRGTLAGRFSPR